MELAFDWDENKAEANLKGHKVSFEEGATAFHDPFVATMTDPDHSDDEDRFIMLGMSFKLRGHCFRENDTAIRIISARKADRGEAASYWR
jgi:uncharacterized DUF497 family protein